MTSTLSERPPAPTIEPGMIFDRYELLAKLADGGMASVWVARQHGKHQFEKLVAMKTILPKFLDNDPFRRMFLDEARIAARIEHTNVARIFDLGEEGPFLYLVMEWVEGDVLSALLRAVAQRKVELPANVFLRIISDACAGLHVAHELTDLEGSCLGVVHRDVSPQNIIVSSEGHAKVIDFGIARANDRLTEETSFGTIKGKVQYMAPEQARGGVITRTADIYAIGAMLYHFFAKRFVYAGATELELMTKLVKGAAVDPLPDTIPEPLRAVIMKAVAFEPGDRYGTMVELRAALEEAMVAVGPRATTADVAAFVKETSGARIAARRERVRAAIHAIDNAEPVPEAASIASNATLPSITSGVTSGVGQSTSSVRLANGARAQTDVPTSETLVLSAPAPARRRAPLIAMVAAGVVVVAVAAFVTRGTWQRTTRPTPATTTAESTATHPLASNSATPAAATAPPGVDTHGTAPSSAPASASTPGKLGAAAPTVASHGHAAAPTAAPGATTGMTPTAPSQTTQPTTSATTTTSTTSMTAAPSAIATATPASTPTVAATPPTPPPATTTTAPAPAPRPFDATHARVTISGVANERGVRKRDVQVALARAVSGMTQCYQSELARLGRAEAGQGTIRFETDATGRIVKANASVAFSSAVARCIERTVTGTTVAGVDTGEAEAAVTVTFEP